MDKKQRQKRYLGYEAEPQEEKVAKNGQSMGFKPAGKIESMTLNSLPTSLSSIHADHHF